MVIRRTLAAALSAALALSAAGCSSTKTADIPDKDPPGPTKAELAKQKAAEEAKKPGPEHATVLPISTDLKKKPAIPDTKGKPPKQLTIKDIVVGTGPAAKSGDAISVAYVGHAWSTNVEFDNSWDRNQDFPVTLGQGAVIKGWDEGLVGMKAGGRRELVIPPALGYGATGSGDKITANETLVFVIDMKKVTPAKKKK